MELQTDTLNAIKWPYPVDYEKINNMQADVLVIGAGAAGSSAGIAAARRGASVIVCEKGSSKVAGNCGAGIDHWTNVTEAPGSSRSADEICKPGNPGNGMSFGTKGPSQVHRDYIANVGTWEALLDIEKMGLPVRDEDGDFEGELTRDEDSGFLKAYNYNVMDTVKLRGGNYVIQILNKELKRLGAQILDRVMITSLLTEEGRQGSRVVGATGFSTETGEFYVFKVKTVIVASGYVCGNWIFSTELTGSSYRWDPNDTGDGLAMAYLAGAKTYSFYSNGTAKVSHPFAWPRFGVGSFNNTWSSCTIRDNNGKEVPWFDKEGQPIEDPADRYMIFGKTGGHLQNALVEAAESGEYELPFWADLSSLPERERRSIWGMMIGNEGKTRYTLYDLYTRSGFNPEKHMLWCPIDPKTGIGSMHGEMGAVKPWRSERGGQGELVVDWDLMTSVPGLFAVGAASGLEGCSLACSSGQYAGNRAAEYASAAEYGDIDEKQLEAEHERVYAPVKRNGANDAYVSWKELWAGTARVMQQCCADYLSESTLKFGMDWMESIRKNEAGQTFARNPHELARVLECETRITVGDLFMKACLSYINAKKEHPEILPVKEEKKEDSSKKGGRFWASKGPEITKYLYNWLENGQFLSEIVEADYFLKEPYYGSFRENYQAHRNKEENK